MAYISHGTADARILESVMDSRCRPTSEMLPLFMDKPTSVVSEEHLRKLLTGLRSEEQLNFWRSLKGSNIRTKNILHKLLSIDALTNEIIHIPPMHQI